jgi:SAM-dependent methyltransferase
MERYYYDEYYRLERGNWWFLARNQIIINHLKQITAGKSNLDILNIGAATGHTSELLVQFGKVISVEYDSICCEFLRQKLKLETVNASVTRLPFENEHFDLVCAFDVIEHVDNDNLAVSEIK